MRIMLCLHNFDPLLGLLTHKIFLIQLFSYFLSVLHIFTEILYSWFNSQVRKHGVRYS